MEKGERQDGTQRGKSGQGVRPVSAVEAAAAAATEAANADARARVAAKEFEDAKRAKQAVLGEAVRHTLKRTRDLHQALLARMKVDDAFLTVVLKLNMSEEDSESLLESLCHACLDQTEDALLGCERGNLVEENQRLQNQLVACNLAAMKDVSNAKCCAMEVTPDMFLNERQFFEPILYLDHDVRELVYRIVVEKVSQLQEETAPSRMVQQIIEAMTRSKSAPQEPVSEKSDEQRYAAQIQALNKKMRLVELRAEEAESRAREADKKLRDLESRALEAETLCLELERRAVRAEEERDRAMDQLLTEIPKLEGQIAQANAKIAELEEEIRRLQEELVDTKGKLEIAEAKGQEFEAKWNDAERRCEEAEAIIVELREVEAQLRTTVKRQEEQVAKLEEKLQAEIKEKVMHRRAAAQSGTRILELEGEVVQLRQNVATQEEEIEDLKRQLIPPEASDRNTQTTMTSSDLDSIVAENAELKVMLEELRMKVKELMDKCKDEEMDEEMANLIQQVGLGPLVNAMGVFERLWLDAQERCVRLEELQRSYQTKMREAQQNTLKWRLVGMEGAGTSAENLSSAADILSQVGEESTLFEQISRGQRGKNGTDNKEQRLPQLGGSPQQRASSEQGRTPRTSKRKVLKEPSSDPLCPIRLPGMTVPAWKQSPAHSLL